MDSANGKGLAVTFVRVTDANGKEIGSMDGSGATDRPTYAPVVSSDRPTLSSTDAPTGVPTLDPSNPTSRPTPAPTPCSSFSSESVLMPGFGMVLEQAGSNSITALRMQKVIYNHLDALMRNAFDSFCGVVTTGGDPKSFVKDGESRVRANFTWNRARFKQNAIPSVDEIQDVLNRGFSGDDLQRWLDDAIDKGMNITRVTVFYENGDTVGTAPS